MRIQMADLKAQLASLHDEIHTAIDDVVNSCRFVLGPNVAQLEEEIALYSQAKHAIGVASGTDAIMLALAACGVGRGDEVITTPFTFVATTETIVLLGATPVYVDIDPQTYNLQADLVEAKITSKTRAILPVHLYGQMADMTALEDIASRHGLALIADGAQAIGATHHNRGLGAFGAASTLSFFPTKNLGAYGDGGMVLTNDDGIADRVKSLRFHGSGGTYAYDHVGWCSRLDEVQAAILRVKLRHLDDWTGVRSQHAESYNRLLAGSGLELPHVGGGNTHVWHQYTVRSDRRDQLKESLKAAEIDSAVYYPSPLHVQPAYKYLGYSDGDFPEAERASQQVLSLPVYPELQAESAQRIARAVLQFQGNLTAA